MNIDFESRNITRRSFLKGAGVVGAAGLLSACGGSKSNNSGSTAALYFAPIYWEKRK